LTLALSSYHSLVVKVPLARTLDPSHTQIRVPRQKARYCIPRPKDPAPTQRSNPEANSNYTTLRPACQLPKLAFYICVSFAPQAFRLETARFAKPQRHPLAAAPNVADGQAAGCLPACLSIDRSRVDCQCAQDEL
jgi:hypothetical protein